MKYNKDFAPLILLAIIVGALVVGGGAVYFATKTPTPPQNIGENNYQPQENQNSTTDIPIKNNQINNTTDNNTTTSKDCLPTTTPWIKVISPNGGETYHMGDSVKLIWKSCNLSSSTYLRASLQRQAPLPDSEWQVPILFGNVKEGQIASALNDGEQTVILDSAHDVVPATYKLSISQYVTPAGQSVIADSSDNSFTILSNSEESTKSEKQIGYIKSIYSKNNTNYLTIDYVQWLPCDTDDCVQSIKVVNDNPLIRTFPISKNVQVKLVTYPDASGNYSLNQNLSLSKFKEALDYSLNNTFNPSHPPEVYYPKTILYWITIENGIITKIEEQFQA